MKADRMLAGTIAMATALLLALAVEGRAAWQSGVPYGAAYPTTTYTPPYLPPAVAVQPQGRPLIGGRTTVVAPRVTFQPVVQQVPTTTFRPVTSLDPCSGTPVTTYMPMTAYRPQVQTSPRLTYDLPPQGLLEWLFPWRRRRIVIAPTAPVVASAAPLQTAMAPPVSPATFAAPIVSDPASVRPSLTTPAPLAPAAPRTYTDEYYTPPPQPDARMRPVPPVREEVYRIPDNNNYRMPANNNERYENHEPAVPDWKWPRTTPSNVRPPMNPPTRSPEDRIAQGSVRLVSYRPAGYETTHSELPRAELVRLDPARAGEAPLDFSGWRAAND